MTKPPQSATPRTDAEFSAFVSEHLDGVYQTVSPFCDYAVEVGFQTFRTAATIDAVMELVLAERAKATVAETERCAKLCEQLQVTSKQRFEMGLVCADAIRATAGKGAVE